MNDERIAKRVFKFGMEGRIFGLFTALLTSYNSLNKLGISLKT